MINALSHKDRLPEKATSAPAGFAPITRHLSNLACLWPNGSPLYLPTLPLLALYDKTLRVSPDRYLPESFMVPGKGPRPLLNQLGRLRQSQLILPAELDMTDQQLRGPQQFTLSPVGSQLLTDLRGALSMRRSGHSGSWPRLHHSLSDEYDAVTTAALVITLAIQQGWSTRACLTQLLTETTADHINEAVQQALQQGLLVDGGQGQSVDGRFTSKIYHVTARGQRAVTLVREL